MMDGILERMQMVTDNTHLKELQADAKLSQADPNVAKSEDTDLSNGDTYHVLNAVTPKDYAVSKVLDSTLRTIDQSTDTWADDQDAKATAIMAAHHAARAGEII